VIILTVDFYMYTQQTMYIFYIWYICWCTIVFMLRVKNEKRKTIVGTPKQSIV